MSEERPRQLGLDVTDFVLARIDNYRPSAKQQRAMRAVMPDKAQAALLAPLVFGAAAEAMAQYQVSGERGILLCDRTYPHQVQLWYVPQADYPAVLGRVTEVTRQDISQLLAAYDPATESVVVLVTVETAQAIQIAAGGTLHSPGIRLRPTLEIPPRLQLPPGVRSRRSQQANGDVTYEFWHEEWGPMGRVHTLSHGAGHTEFRVDVANGRPGDPIYEQRLVLFQNIAQEIETKLKRALGDHISLTGQPTGLGTMVASMKLFAAFRDIPNDFEMAQFVRCHSDEELDALVDMVTQALPRASWQDARALRQRLAELARIRQNPPDISPVVQGIYDFLQPDSEAEARALLTVQPDLLLTDEAWAVLSEFFADTPQAQAHLRQRRLLWQETRQQIRP